jgi:hypothetical protein
LIGFQNWHGCDPEDNKLYPFHELKLGRSVAYLFTTFYCLFYLNEHHKSREVLTSITHPLFFSAATAAGVEFE